MTRSVVGRWTLAVVAATITALTVGAPRAHAEVGDAFVDGCLTAGTAVAPCAAAPGLTKAYREALSPDGKELYVVVTGGGGDDPAVLVFDRDPATGKLTRRANAGGCVTQSGSSGGCGQASQLSNPQDIVVSPDGANVYVSDAGTNSVIELARAADGALSATPACLGNGTGCTLVTGMGVAHALGITPDGRSVYLRTDGGTGQGTLLVFDRAANGTLTQKPAPDGCWSEVAQPGCTVGAGLSHQSWQMAATNTNVYATGWNESYYYFTSGCGVICINSVPPSGTIAIFGRNADGSLTQAAAPAGCISSNGASGGLANSGPAPVRCADGSDGLDEARGVTLSPDGKSLYVAGLSAIVSYSRGAGGALTETGCLEQPGAGKPGCTDVTGIGDGYRMAVTPSGTDLIATSVANRGVVFLERDPATGVLSQRTGTKRCLTKDGTAGACDTLAPLGGLGDVTVSPDSTFAYLVSQDDGMLATLHRDVAPRCQDETISVPYQTSVAVPLTCTDANGDALTLAIAHQPTNGTLAGAIDTAASTIRYSPPLGYSGPDGFDYVATGRGVQSSPAHVTLNVQPPVAPGGGGGGGDGTGGGGGDGTGGGGGTITPPPPAAKRMPAKVAATWKVAKAKLTLTALTIKKLPKGWHVKATCKGKKCPFKSKTLKARKVKTGTLNALKLLGSKRVFHAGQTLELRISATGYTTKLVRYTLEKGKHPKAVTRTS